MQNLNQPIRKWRRINPYTCSRCGKPRYSFIFGRAKEKICRTCVRGQVAENQQSLFDLDHENMPKNLKENLKTSRKIKVVENRERQALGRGDYETKEEDLGEEIKKIAFGRDRK